MSETAQQMPCRRGGVTSRNRRALHEIGMYSAALTQADFEGALDLLLEVNRAPEPHAFRERIAGLRSLIGADAIRYEESGPQREADASFSHPPGAQNGSDVDRIALSLSAPDGATARVELLRAEPGFSAAHRELATLLAPHLEHAFGQVRARAHPPVSSVSDDRLAALGLTGRQTEIARLLIANRSPEEIAVATSISPHTARKHVANIYLRLGVHSRAEAVTRLLGVDSTDGAA